MEDEAAVTCAYCGADLSPGAGLVVDLRPRVATGEDDASAGEPVRITACSHGHAARWLDGDEPPSSRTPAGRRRLTWGDRVTVGALLVALALLVGLTLVGVWTVIGWLS